ncbi:hypothetical protein V202x_32340 [Gimesia aquarii]|uniref:Uncharacterized protein n=1 Tax=Gimesia aquarii TaxID=2527964 RepID=A0A517WX39_9PLAN|nr:hypothetical protein V202x_32340 [Gimesia aquarii]
MDVVSSAFVLRTLYLPTRFLQATLWFSVFIRQCIALLLNLLKHTRSCQLSQFISDGFEPLRLMVVSSVFENNSHV